MRRPRRGRIFWARMIAEQIRSGLSVPEFCAERDLGQRTFSRWQRKLNAMTTRARPPAFIEVPVAPTAPPPSEPSWDIELELGEGIRLRVRRG